MLLNENEARNLLTKILKNSTADSALASLRGENIYNLRFARNSLTTNGFSDGLSLRITSNFGKKSGTVTTNRLDDESVKTAVKKSEDIARLSPDNREFMPHLGAQSYTVAKNYSADTENLLSEKRSEYVSYIVNESVKNGVISAGYIEDAASFSAIMNTTGLFAYNKSTMAKLSDTARTPDGTGSSRFEKNFFDINLLDHKTPADKVIERSKLSANPKEIPPGRYTVILEPSAAADMIGNCLRFMGARGADEGRSYFSRQGGGSLIGELLADPKVNIYSDPADLNAPSIPFTEEGEPISKVTWFENGVLKNLHRNRFWADKTSQPSVPYPSNIVMEGTEKSVETLISETQNGVLLTRLWYIRTVDPKTMLLTGLTRDGVFEIKDGKISRSLKNFRFNESPINILKNVIDMSASEKAVGAETDDFPIYVPALKVADFNFSSLSDAI